MRRGYCQWRNEGAQSPGRRVSAGTPDSPSNVTNAFSNSVHLLPKDLRSNTGASNLLLAPGVI